MYKNEELQPKGASVVYWIHRPQHTDITKEGYIGISNTRVRNRWIDHKGASRRNVNGKCDVLAKAIRKYPDIIYEVILVADTREYCERIENLLRPTNKIGWNIARGGMPVDTMMGGIANKERWIKYWIDNPSKAADRWWQAELLQLRNEIRQKKKEESQVPPPHTKERKFDKRNTSGLTGVTWHHKIKKWHAQMGFQSNTLHLGFFVSKEEAYDAYLYGVKIRTAYRKGELSLKNAWEILQAFRFS